MNKKKYPKVLVVSHNSFSNYNNMGITISNFFKGWNKENIAQLYFQNESPTSTICNNYFRITDVEMLKKLQPGNEIKKSDIKTIKQASDKDSLISKLYKLGRERRPHVYLLRNLLWSTKKWKTKKLIDWINSFNPDVLFYAAGDYVFSMEIALQISKMKNIPLIVYFGDEYYFMNNSKSLIGKYNEIKYKRKFDELFNSLTSFISASSKMKNKYESEFNKSGYAVLNAATINHDDGNILEEFKDKITYLGNVSLGRSEALIDIGKVLKKYGKVIDVYSGETREAILKDLVLENGIRFNGSVDSITSNKITQSSQIVLHVESMQEEHKLRTKYSLSTKIGNLLSSEVCILAYGPGDISSIEYLRDNNVACTVTAKNQLEKKISELLNDSNLRKKYVENAKKLAEERHNLETNTIRINEIINNIVNKA